MKPIITDFLVILHPMILIAPDKFKGTFTAEEICSLVAGRLKAAGIDMPVVTVPLSDGGEGAAATFMPDGKKIATGVYESLDGSCRLVVSSEIIGNDAFAGKNIPLMHRSSILLGRAIVPDIPTTVAVGGTATSDGGAGFLQGLGVKFYDACNNEIKEPLCPKKLPWVKSADISALKKYRLRGIIDVKADLVSGPLSAMDFAPQKALDGESLDGLKAALSGFHAVLGGKSPWDGAGGGLGYALAGVAHAPCCAGAEKAVKRLEGLMAGAELIITGEGRVDLQTSRGGKLVDAVFKAANARNLPVMVLYGAPDSAALYPVMAQINSDWETVVRQILQ